MGACVQYCRKGQPKRTRKAGNTKTGPAEEACEGSSKCRRGKLRSVELRGQQTEGCQHTHAELCHTCVLTPVCRQRDSDRLYVLLLLLLSGRDAPRLLQHTHSSMRQTNADTHTQSCSQ